MPRFARLLSVPIWLWVCLMVPRTYLLVRAWQDPAQSVTADSKGYLQLAENLLRHRLFSRDAAPPYTPETIRLPGYPLFLVPALWTPKPVFTIALVQILLSAFVTVLLWVWLVPRTGRPSASFATLLLGLDLVTLCHEPQVLAEVLLNALLIAALVFFWRLLDRDRESPLAAGLLWALAAFVKPIVLYLPVFLSLFLLKRPRVMILFLLAAYVLPVLWMLRNEHQTGKRVFTSLDGIVLLRYPAAQVEAMRTGRPLRAVEQELVKQVTDKNDSGFDDQAKESDAYGTLAREILRSHPFYVIRLCIVGTIRVMYGLGLEMIVDWTGNRPASIDAGTTSAAGIGTLYVMKRHPWLLPVGLLYFMVLRFLSVIFLLGCWRMWASGLRLHSLFLFITVAYLVGIAAHQGYYRFRIPAMPFMIVACAYAFKRHFEERELDRRGS
jgi:hypothetical protein